MLVGVEGVREEVASSSVSMSREVSACSVPFFRNILF